MSGKIVPKNMNWQTLSILCCLLWGTCSILCANAVGKLGPYQTLFINNAALFVAATGIYILKGDFANFGKNPNYAFLALLAGILSAIGILFQFMAFEKSPKHIPWIVLICVLYPGIVITYTHIVKDQKFTPREWVAAAFAITAIILFCWPNKANVH